MVDFLGNGPDAGELPKPNFGALAPMTPSMPSQVSEASDVSTTEVGASELTEESFEQPDLRTVTRPDLGLLQSMLQEPSTTQPASSWLGDVPEAPSSTGLDLLQSLLKEEIPEGTGTSPAPSGNVSEEDLDCLLQSLQHAEDLVALSSSSPDGQFVLLSTEPSDPAQQAGTKTLVDALDYLVESLQQAEGSIASPRPAESLSADEASHDLSSCTWEEALEVLVESLQHAERLKARILELSPKQQPQPDPRLPQPSERLLLSTHPPSAPRPTNSQPGPLPQVSAPSKPQPGPPLLSTQPPLPELPSNAALERPPERPPEQEVVSVMVKNLPKYFTQDMFLTELVAGGFKGKFDFLYIPYSLERCGNLGYGILNFRKPEYARQFRTAFHNGCLDEMQMSDLRLIVEQAPLQGYEANMMDAKSVKPPLGRADLPPEMGQVSDELFQ